MKIQIKEMFETVGKDAQGKAVRKKIGTMYCESIAGRVGEILKSCGEDAVAGFVDDQVLHHPASAAFKAKGGKVDAAEGLDRLAYAPQDGRQLYKTPLIDMVMRDEKIKTFQDKIESLAGETDEDALKVVANAQRRIDYYKSLPKVERPQGLTDEQLQEIDVVRVNWNFKPGQSAAAVKAAEKAAELEATIQKSIEAQLELLAMNGTEITEEFKAKVEAFVRAKFA